MTNSLPRNQTIYHYCSKKESNSGTHQLSKHSPSLRGFGTVFYIFSLGSFCHFTLSWPSWKHGGVHRLRRFLKEVERKKSLLSEEGKNQKLLVSYQREHTQPCHKVKGLCRLSVILRIFIFLVLGRVLLPRESQPKRNHLCFS